MSNILIKKYIWNKKENNIIFNSLKEFIDINNLSRYIPILSLYFYYHNTKNSKKLLDIDKKYYVMKINECNDFKYYNSNKLAKITLLNMKNNTLKETDCFIKIIPILDVISYIKNNYNSKNNLLIPNNYTYNTYSKINSLYNSCYIDVFVSYIIGELSNSNANPSFPKFYSHLNGIMNNFKYDITEEYFDIINTKWFRNNIGDKFNINIYKDTSDSDSETNSSHSSNSSNNSNINSLSQYSEEDNNDYVACIDNFPVQLLFIEKLDGTLTSLFPELEINLLISCYFQINFCLIYLQKKLKFTHNDLHTSNIMFKNTDKKFLYYKYNNLYFKVPTYGKIFKIIDFGRSIFTFKNKLFHNDVFSFYGECEGQYNYPISNIDLFINDKYKDENNIKPNFSFDMCRLTTSVIEEINEYEIFKDKNKDIDNFMNLLNLILKDKDNVSIYSNSLKDNFDLYINIAKNACNGIPYNIINHKVFQKYKINKKKFPKKYYSI
tara:strand:- start:486 stop:1964 length:1479 start_codon:yes stop_codon:yes gene_type:complete